MGSQDNIKSNGTDVYTQVIVPSGLQTIVEEEKKRFLDIFLSKNQTSTINNSSLQNLKFSTNKFITILQCSGVSNKRECTFIVFRILYHSARF